MHSLQVVMPILCAGLLTACSASKIAPEDPTRFIPDLSSEILAGQTERAKVHSVLGTPVLSSTYWGFDLFRTDTEQTELRMAVTPVPVPFQRIKDQLQRYTLVLYDTNVRASAVATGIFRKPAAWRTAAPIAYDFPSLHLHAGELMFFIIPAGGREPNLLASPIRRDIFLRDAGSSERCTVIAGCGERGCADQLAVDGGPVRRLPMRAQYTVFFKVDELDGRTRDAEYDRSSLDESLVAIPLVAGEHDLTFSASHLDGRTAVKLTCHPGEVVYLVINASSNENFWNPALVDWHIDRTHSMPQPFMSRPLFLIYDGQWYTEAEPGG